jgi:hypothetical protein
MFVSFCALLKWQQYDTRLQLPLLVAAGPIVAVTIARAGRPVIRWTATAPLFLFAIVFLLFNECRPFVTARSIFHRPAADQYFADNPSYEPGFTGAAAIIRRDRIRQIGLATTHDTFEYPLWVYLSDVRGLRMENIAPRNGTARYEKFPPFNTFTPDAIVATRTELLTASELIYRHRRYRRSFAGGGVALFERVKEGA